MSTSLDLDAYFQRIRWTGAASPTLATLAGLLQAHASHIPFENLDVLLRRPIPLDLESIQAKLVHANRGGYCFEHATLFAAVLEAIGFTPARHAARVVLFGSITEMPRSHMFLTVSLDGAAYVVDPGFGPFAPPFPVPLLDGHTQQTHWMARDGGLWTLHVPRDGQTVPGWTSTLEHENPIDFEVSNHIIATHPTSMFTNIMILSASTPKGRINIMNRGVMMLHEGTATRTQLADRVALRSLLVSHFGFDLPEVEAMRVPAISEWD